MRLRRKHVVVLHLRSGATIKFVCSGWKITSRENDLTRFTWTRSNAPEYSRLDAVDAITIRKAFLQWYLA